MTAEPVPNRADPHRTEPDHADRPRNGGTGRDGVPRWLAGRMWPFRRYIALHLGGSIVWQALTAAIPLVTGLAFDAIINEGGTGPDFSAFHTVVAVLLAIVLVRGVGGIASTYCLETFASGLERDARAQVFSSLLGKRQGYFNRRRTGDLSARSTGDAEALNLMVSPGFDMAVDLGLNILMPLIVIAIIEPRLLLSPVVFVVLFAVALAEHGRRLEPVSDLTRERFGDMTAHASESVAGMEVVESTGSADQERTRFTELARAYRDAAVRQARTQALSFLPLLLSLATAGALVHSVILLREGAITIGELVAVLGLMGTLRAPTQLASFSLGLIHLGLAGARRIMEIVDDRSGEEHEGGSYAARIEGAVAMEDVTFSYDPGRPVLRDVSFRVAPGQTVAVVGATGSGKSTLLHLLNRTYTPDTGRILVDGVDTAEWDTEVLRSQIAMIEQDVTLFSRTIAENLSLGVDGEIDRERLEAAARTAQAHDFIAATEHGYDTVVGERGVNLSGGQRQRLAIARAIAADPRILALDDATSAIDSGTERELQLAMRQAAAGRTTFLVTPRLSRIRAADHILVLDAGRIVGQGTHDQLIRNCAVYRRIFAPYQDRQRPTANGAVCPQEEAH
ncbi:ATP-binding cassette subfamily B protein [Nocardiopsis mwathae]|uniref:ATP-binding cassette subfamily B protein n=1 Tax=Nocardiopsis mwathae TaxID=1472723 RepID=A0A7W9YI78_9ACTN|nr:ABC transporter ATP-binding protein [Nocardiopsis mwathae]MBB6172645.1 ATP-binding cassette subfamily B protein [Nocardiopsis mwathae]